MDVDRALDIIRKISPLEKPPVEVPAAEAVNSILAQDVVALADSPRHDNSAMDGYVFRKEDLDSGLRRFPVTGDIRPEDESRFPVAPQTCARIVTGAPVPPGGDFVVPVELVEAIDRDADASHIQVNDLPQKNPVRKRGEGFRKGETLLEKGTVIRAYESGLMIESGHSRCPVRSPLRIAVQVTGSEVTGQNNSNGPVLQAIMNSWPGTEVVQHPVVGDDPGRIRDRLLDLKSHSDVIVTTGGISAGAYDYLYDVLVELDARPQIRKINQKPGKPFTLFLWDNVVVCCLPGNPVSAVCTDELYVREVVQRLHGLPPVAPLKAKLKGHVDNPGNRTLFLPVRLRHHDSTLTAETGSDPRMRSHLLQLFRDCNGFMQVPPATTLQPENLVSCYFLSQTVMKP